MTFSGDERDRNYWQLIQWSFSLPHVALVDDLLSERDTCQQRCRIKVLCEWRTWVNVEAVKKEVFKRLHKWWDHDFFYNCQCFNIHVYVFVESYASAVYVCVEWILIYILVNVVFLSFRVFEVVFLIFLTFIKWNVWECGVSLGCCFYMFATNKGFTKCVYRLLL